MTPPARTALVTGASSGLGRELVGRLVRERGMTVCATARRRGRLDDLLAEHPEGSVRVLDGDIADPRFRAELWTWAERETGGVDLLINNAGVGYYSDFAEMPPDEVRRIIEINLMAVFDLTARAIRSMRARGRGEIVQVSSVLGTFGIPYSAVYAASKHGVDGLVKGVRHELRGSGVNLWSLRPTRFASEFRRASLAGRGKDQAGRGEPVGAIAAGLIAHLGTRRGFVTPTLRSTLMVALPHWLPGPFDWVLRRLGPGRFSKEVGGAIGTQGGGGGISPPGSAP